MADFLNYADLTEEQRADLDRQVRMREERRQKRDLERAKTLGRMAAAEDRNNAFLRRLAARNRT